MVEVEIFEFKNWIRVIFPFQEMLLTPQAVLKIPVREKYVDGGVSPRFHIVVFSSVVVLHI